jgi:hypothetical protein
MKIKTLRAIHAFVAVAVVVSLAAAVVCVSFLMPRQTFYAAVFSAETDMLPHGGRATFNANIERDRRTAKWEFSRDMEGLGFENVQVISFDRLDSPGRSGATVILDLDPQEPQASQIPKDFVHAEGYVTVVGGEKGGVRYIRQESAESYVPHYQIPLS